MIGDFLNQVLREFVARERRRDRVRSAVLKRFELTAHSSAVRRHECHEQVAEELGETVSNELCGDVKRVLRELGCKEGSTGGRTTYRGLRIREASTSHSAMP